MFNKLKKWFSYHLAIYRINRIAEDLGVTLGEWQYSYILYNTPFPDDIVKQRGIGKTTAVMIKLFYKTGYEHDSIRPKTIWDILNEDPDFRQTRSCLFHYRNYYYNLLDKITDKRIFNNRIGFTYWNKVCGFLFTQKTYTKD